MAAFAMPAALCLFGGQQLLGADTEFEPIRGAKLHLDLTVGEARVEVVASGFYERVVSGGPRELFATQIRITAAGRAAANYQSTPIGDGWLEKVEVNAAFDQNLEVQITPEVGLQWAATNSPVQLRVIPESISPPARPHAELRIRAGNLKIADDANATVNVTAGSKITEKRILRVSKEGEMVDLPKPPTPSADYFAEIDIQVGVAEDGAELQHRQHQPPPLRFIDPEAQSVSALSKNRIVLFRLDLGREQAAARFEFRWRVWRDADSCELGVHSGRAAGFGFRRSGR